MAYTKFIIVTALIFSFHRGTSGARSEYCEHETFTASCNADEVVVMRSAIYGRMTIGRCITIDFGYIGCQKDVLDYMDKQCSGRRSCEVIVGSVGMQEEIKSPCSRDLTSFLTADYECVKVVTPVNQQCENSAYSKVTAKQGYIASVLTQETGIGSLECPWKLEASPGQYIQLTVLDFGGNRRQNPFCRVYGIVRESATRRSFTLCEGKQREQQVYVSKSPSIEVRVMTRNNRKMPYFLLKFEVKSD